jgi:GntR family transcriptional regulator
MLRINPAEATPIWKQIEDEVRRLIAANVLPPGSVVPSVRDLARQLRINPGTVAKAYNVLTDAGVLEVKRGEGTFVREQQPTIRKSERARTFADAAMKYASTAVLLGAPLDEAEEQLRIAYERLGKSRGGNGDD